MWLSLDRHCSIRGLAREKALQTVHWALLGLEGGSHEVLSAEHHHTEGACHFLDRSQDRQLQPLYQNRGTQPSSVTAEKERV